MGVNELVVCHCTCTCTCTCNLAACVSSPAFGVCCACPVAHNAHSSIDVAQVNLHALLQQTHDEKEAHGQGDDENSIQEA